LRSLWGNTREGSSPFIRTKFSGVITCSPYRPKVGLAVPGLGMSHVDNPDRAPPDNMGCQQKGACMVKVWALKALSESIMIRDFALVANVRQLAHHAFAAMKRGRIGTALLYSRWGRAG
jgi:hypothetical protein